MKNPNPYLIDDENPELDDEWFKHAGRAEQILPPELFAVLPKLSADDFELAEYYDFSDGIRGKFYRPKKVSTTIQLDDDILVFLKKQANEQHIAYQALVNAVLRDYVSKSGQCHSN